MDFSEHLSSRFSENLAFDEWLLDRAAASAGECESLRIWRPESYAVVIGRGSKYAEEVDSAFCFEQGIPVLRRHSGGAAVVSGPGCWMYAVVLDLRKRPELRDLQVAHRTVMEVNRAAAQSLVPEFEIQLQGVCDLTVNDRKCSGNSLRVLRNHLLYHGTLLIDFDLTFLGKCLKTPPRQPDYRLSRPHEQFVTNLAESCGDFAEVLWGRWRNALQLGWNAVSDSLVVTPEIRVAVARLAEEKYESDAWTRTR